MGSGSAVCMPCLHPSSGMEISPADLHPSLAQLKAADLSPSRGPTMMVCHSNSKHCLEGCVVTQQQPTDINAHTASGTEGTSPS